MRLVMVVIALASSLAWPCGLVDSSPTLHTRMNGEKALVVWDPARKLQHFIRFAKFAGEHDDLGFIVPTPAVPEFGAMPQGLFLDMMAAHDAAQPHVTRFEFGSAVFRRRADALSGQASVTPDVVSVLKEEHVAGLDVAVVKAQEVESLRRWLSEHHFSVRAELEPWLRHYVEKGWVFSCFRYPLQHGTVTTEAVRISFPTEEPFYPYYEPLDVPERSFPSVVWLVAPGPMRWQDQSPNAAGHPRPRLRVSTPSIKVPSEVAALLPGVTPWTTLYMDSRGRRPQADVTFVPTTDEPIEPPAIVSHVFIPIELVFGMLALGAVVVKVRRRRR